ncbi:MAG TPA: alpha/beta hydrolase [Trebonia sp.]|nr:alpha/beta hydrolase [Trebonia sp.]
MTEPAVRYFPGRDGLKLACRQVGEGRPLIMVHGFMSSGLLTLPHGPATALADHGYRVILPDLRGHGDSGRPHDPASYPPDVLADDGLALIDWLGLGPGDYDLGGYSLGGRVVLRLLARGARPSHAVVGGQGLDATEPASDRTGGYRRLLAAVASGAAFESGTPDAFMAQWIADRGGDPMALSLVLDTFAGTSPAELEQVPTPTLIVVGDQDRRGDSAAELAALLPGGRIARVPGDHFTAMSAPEFVTAIISFLGDRSRR